MEFDHYAVAPNNITQMIIEGKNNMEGEKKIQIQKLKKKLREEESLSESAGRRFGTG